MLTKEEQQQYSRHILLDEVGEDGQLHLKKAKVLVIGAGGLGCPILQYLTAAGVGTIGIIDHDVVSQSNLQRQILYTIEDINKPKVLVAKQRLAKLNPFVQFVTYTKKLTKDNAESIFRDFDIVVDGSDNFQTRYLVNDAALLTDKPLVYGAIFKFEGQVSVFNYKNGPSYRCLFPTPPKPNEVPNCSQIGVVGVLPGIIGCLQANEVIKMICGLGDVLSGKLLTYNLLNMQQLQLKFNRTEQANRKSLEENYDAFCGFDFTINEISKIDFEEQKDAYNLLDVRTYEERAQHHIGGMHIPLDELASRFEEIPLTKPLVVYCKSGNRSKKAISLLHEKELPLNVLNLEGGIG